MTIKKKRGRPTNAIKEHTVRFRISDGELAILDDLCTHFKKTRSEVLRNLVQSVMINEWVLVEENKTSYLFPEQLTGDDSDKNHWGLVYEQFAKPKKNKKEK
ncbi:hypothetical protein [Anaerorhabdus sp.]|uniref:hypothetical protein n=1 Tax=Anaerorhabdus sp. TaxID=1872524 RepID=UPI002B1F25B8|nr:hypothetical protein [Anaerorhabdus sp.]MEA4875271.1 hypothetical protein [Anaerorhabdus sp.]